MKRADLPNALLTAALASAALASTPATRAAEPGPDTLIAHQGASRDAPGNTLPAFRLAVERGFGFECDINVSTDGKVFTFHDDTLARTTDGADKRRVDDLAWAEIESIDAGGWGKWKGSRFAGTRPALLEEVLELARDGRWIYLDTKPRPEIVPLVARALAGQGRANPSNVLFIASSEEVCAAYKRELPEYKVFWISFTRGRVGQPHKPPAPPITAAEVVETLRRVGADGVDMQFDPAVHDEDYIRAVHDAGFEFHVWTVNDPELARLAFRRGVTSLTTDSPDACFDISCAPRTPIRLFPPRPRR